MDTELDSGGNKCIFTFSSNGSGGIDLDLLCSEYSTILQF